MGNIFSSKGKADRAITLYRRAIELEPSYVPAYLELGKLLKALGRSDECVALYRRAAESIPEEQNVVARLHELLLAATSREESPAVLRAQQAEPDLDDQPGRAHVVIYADCSGIGGAEQANHAIAMGLRGGGYRVTFVQPRAEHHLIEERSANGIPHVWIEQDDIYGGGAASPSLCSVAEGDAVFGRVRGDLVLFCDGSPVSNLGAKQVAMRMGIPSVALVHCVWRDWAALFSRYLMTLGVLYRASRQVIAVSQDNLALLRECFGLPGEMGAVIHNGVSPTFFEARNPHVRNAVRGELGIPDEAVVCLTVARMEPVKGYQLLLKAIRELRRRPVGEHLQFIWIGAGSLEPRIRAMIDEIAARQAIHLVHRTSSVERYLDAADIFVLPSMFEGMPISIMEAMAKGLPVMATAVSGTPEELGGTGVLLPDPTVEGERTIACLTDGLERWALDESLRRKIGHECRRRAERMFVRDRMVADYLRLVETALGDEGRVVPAKQSIEGVCP
jgi:glycosyltransferase involved in cell wall biosynthesis